MANDLSYPDRRGAITTLVAAVQDFAAITPLVPTTEIAEMMGTLSWLAAHTQAAMVALTAEAESRGVISSSQASSTTRWVGEVAWQTQNHSAASIAKASRVSRRPELAAVWEQLVSGDLPVSVANTVAAEFDKLAPHLNPAAHQPVLEQLINAGAEFGSRQVRRLREEIFARFASTEEFEDAHDKCRGQISLSAGSDCGNGTWHYELITDTEGRAVLEAAIGPLSAPTPGPDGEPDLRSAAQRRGQALIQVCRRATAAAAGVPVSPKAVLMVTMNYTDLADQVGSGTTLGARGAGEHLTPSTIRRIACEAGVIPVVLGGKGEILDLGRTERLFTPGQEAALRLRDRHCTFDGCTVPATWCDKHHLIHWADGGPTDLGNSGLLCPRHHSIVHRDQLAGWIADGLVVWDRRPGSYQRRQRTTAA